MTLVDARQPGARRRLWLVGSCLLLGLGLLLAAALYVRSHALELFGGEALFRHASRHLTAEQKREFYAHLARTTPAGVWEAIPEPRVGRVVQFGVRKMDLGAELVGNDAGMRSRRPYVPKAPDRFRIVCLGDSMVMGTAGREEDRWGDQIEALLRERGVKVDGKEVEVYSLGIGGWSALNAAAYLSHRITSYAPDVVLVMMVDNDLNDSGAVMGIGQVTYGFTSDHRDLGSGVLVDHWPLQFGLGRKNLLAAGMGPESRSRWREAFGAWKRLEALLDATGGRMVFGVLRSGDLFLEQSRRSFAEAGLRSPFIVTEYLGRRLPHDPHPDREGHALLAAHYLHVLAKLGWVPVKPDDLPPLPPSLDVRTEQPQAPERLRALQSEVAQEVLREEIAFDRMGPQDARAVLGGLYAGSDERPLGSPPYGTLKSVFLLGRRPGAAEVRVEVEVPPYPELFPFRLDLLLDGRPAGRLDLETAAEAGRHAFTGAIPASGEPDPALEVSLRTESYWTGVTDFTMKSYRLISARQEGSRQARLREGAGPPRGSSR